MSKKIIYDYDEMLRAGKILNLISVTGVNNIRLMAELSVIMDSGKVEEEQDKKGETEDGDK